MRVRLTDLSLRSSVDPRYIFYAYDCIANVNLRGQDSRIVLSRGFIQEQGTTGLRPNRSKTFNTDAIDSRPIVNRLAAAIAERQGTYFYTQTCNQRDFYGVRPIKRWIDSQEFEEQLRERYGAPSGNLEMEELLRAARQGSCVPIVRNWMEAAEIHMTYVARSPEQPLGKIERIFWRHENQDSKGNVTHIHAILWTADTDREQIIDRIRGSVSDLIRPDEVEGYLQEGLLCSEEEVFEVREQARKILYHTCNPRCRRRTGPGPNDFRCRHTNTARDSPRPTEHCLKQIDPHHTEEAISILSELELCDEQSTPSRFIPTDARFVCEKYYAPCDLGERPMSPTNGRLFIATRSSSNLQLCTPYFSCRYLAKYVAGIDDNNVVYVGAGSERSAALSDDKYTDPIVSQSVCLGDRMEPILHMEETFLHNTKIASSAINEKKAQAARRNQKHPKGRAMSITEALALVLGYPHVYTDMEFEEIPTVALEERAGVERLAPVSRMSENDDDFGNVVEPPRTPADIDAGRTIPIYRVRNIDMARELPEWRRVSASEELLLKDQCFSPVSVDKITVFGVRPPELRFVRSPAMYFRWFHRSRPVQSMGAALEAHENAVSRDIFRTAWIDGLNCKVRLRPAAIDEVVQYIEEGGTSVPRVTGRLFARLQAFLASPPVLQQQVDLWTFWQNNLLVSPDEIRAGKLRIPVFSNIKPTQAHRFLIHILLSMGSYENELELFFAGDIRAAFRRAGLLSDVDPERSIVEMLRKYVVEQLLFSPGGTSTFDRLLVAAYSVLTDALLRGQLPVGDLPSYLYTSLREATGEKVAAHLEQSRRKLAEATVQRIQGNVANPTIGNAEAFVRASRSAPRSGAVEVMRGATQSEESYAEQREAFCIAKELLAQYCSACDHQVKSLCIVGGPGCGKTFVMGLIILEAMGRGLNAVAGALMAERSLFLGGVHIHKLFELPVNESATPHRLAELALLRLYRYPEALAVLRCMDVLGLDELGQLSAEMLACLDMILRRVRESSQFMGGVLIISTMDPEQLKPVKGNPVLLSPAMLTSFRCIMLTHSVRASRDPILQRIQHISRMLPIDYTPEVLAEFRTLVGDNCTFVESWDDPKIEHSMLRVFGKKQAVAMAEKKLLGQILHSNQPVLISQSRDYQRSRQSHSAWVAASQAAVRVLNKRTKEVQKVYFYEGAVYEMTYNKKGVFSQSQLALLAEMPTRDQVHNFRSVRLMVAPEGCKAVPEEITNPQDLVQQGWKPCMIGMAPERVNTTSAGVKVKRQQYGIRHRIASTIHAAMGSDVGKLVTAVSNTEKQYQLWQKEQAVVLLSRTSFAVDMIFVGDKDDALNALVALLKIRGQYSEYMQHLLEVLSTPHERSDSHAGMAFPAVEQRVHPFRPKDVALPDDATGFCYILVSLRDYETTYIGQTMRLLKRLKRHNTGYGSLQTGNHRLRPWAILAFVCGFDGNRQYMLKFEHDWKAKRDLITSLNGPLAPIQTAQLARDVMADWDQSESLGLLQLRFVETGTFGFVGENEM